MLDVRSTALLAGDSPRHPLGDGEALFLIASVANLSKELLLIRKDFEVTEEDEHSPVCLTPLAPSPPRCCTAAW